MPNPEHYHKWLKICKKTDTMVLVKRMTERQYVKWIVSADIMEHICGFTRQEAERLAALDVLEEGLPKQSIRR
jgi:hypothetical protein